MALWLCNGEMQNFQDLVSGVDWSQNISSEKYHLDAQHSTSNDRLVVIYNIPKVQIGVVQPIIDVPRPSC